MQAYERGTLRTHRQFSAKLSFHGISFLLILFVAPSVVFAQGLGKEEELLPIQIGRFLLYPSADFIYEYDTNVRRTNENDPVFVPISSSVRNIRPGFRLEMPFERGSADLDYQAQFRDFADETLGNADGVSHVLDAYLQIRLTPILKMKAAQKLIRGVSELLEVDPGGELRFGTRPYVISATAATFSAEFTPIQSVEIGAIRNSTSFGGGSSNDSLYDLESKTLSSRYVITSSPENQYYLALNLQRVQQHRGAFSSLQPTDFERRYAGVGLRRLIAPDLISELWVAYERTRFTGDIQGVPFHGVSLEGELISQLTVTSQARLKLRRGPLQSFFNVNVYYLNEMLQLTFEQKLGLRLAARFQGGYQRNAYPEAVRIAVSGPEEQALDGDGNGVIDGYEYLLPSEGVKRKDTVRNQSFELLYDFMRGLRLALGVHRDSARSNIRAVGCTDPSFGSSNCPVAEKIVYDLFDYDNTGVTASLTLGWK
jgi:hypothetical protein